MSDIVSQVRKVSDLIGEISSASIEQTAGISQVGIAVAQLDTVTQQNAALVEESAAAAAQAAGLTLAVSVFKFGNEDLLPVAKTAAITERRNHLRLRAIARRCQDTSPTAFA